MKASKKDDNVEILYRDKYDYNKFIGETDSYIIACGGDGTLLKAIHKYAYKSKPFFGRAAGTVNFLMNKDRMPMKGHKVKTFHRLKVTVHHQRYERDMAGIDDVWKDYITSHYAFNDVCIGGEDGMNAFIDFNIEEKDEIFGEIKGGGLIISTPPGSTGINKTNGGSVLPLSANYWSVTGDKTTRPVEYVVRPNKMSITPRSRKSVIVWIDGANEVLHNVSKVVVEKGDTVQVIFNDYSEFKRKRRI